MKRILCKNIHSKFIGKNLQVSGWIKNIRKLGFLTFIELADHTERIQLVFQEDFNNNNVISKLSRESVITIEGILQKRKSINEKIFNGDLEIIVTNIIVHSIAETTPLIIEEETDALEEVRFENRYLDLRRPNVRKIFQFKSKLYQKIHEFLAKKEFNFIETPILAKPTPEGARDYLVPSRIKKGNFYALPQSPQIYKQLLMVSGFDKYYQIAKCFRDEDLRSDRQPEFTQLDMELSFIDEEQIYSLIEELMTYIFKETMNKKIKTPFKRITYKDAMLHYGNDKPDTRFNNKILDSLHLVNISENEMIKELLSGSNRTCRTVAFKENISRKQIEELDGWLKNNNLRSSSYIKIFNNEISGPLAKKIEPEIIYKIFKQHKLKEGIVFINFGETSTASVQLGVIRIFLANKLEIIDKNKFNFLWVVDWPLFEYNEEQKRYVAAHHPFTQPQENYHTTFDKNPETALARAYDLVLNGVEVGGGSIRIVDRTMQERMFSTIGMSKTEYETNFSTLLNAFQYGVPPHGGIAFGLDRLTQLLLNLNNIKECIAFPKNTNAYDQTIKTPSKIDDATINELGLKII